MKSKTLIGALFVAVLGLALLGGRAKKAETSQPQPSITPVTEQSEPPAPVMVASVPVVEQEAPVPAPVIVAEPEIPVSETPTPVIVEFKFRSLTRVSHPPATNTNHL